MADRPILFVGPGGAAGQVTAIATMSSPEPLRRVRGLLPAGLMAGLERGGACTGDLGVAATGLPRTFILETVLGCGLRCPECPVGARVTRRTWGKMAWPDFERIVERIRPYAREVLLHNWGEPLGHERLLDMIRATAPFARVNVSTHAQLLTPERADALLDSGLKELIVSVDGVTQEVYERYRVGGLVERAIGSLAYLAAANQRRGRPVQIMPQFLVFAHNVHEQARFAALCEGLGLTPSFKAPSMRWGSGLEPAPGWRRPEHPDLASLRQAMQDCPDPHATMTVLRDGAAVMCCHDHDGTQAFGNLLEQDVPTIWSSPAYRAFREAVVTGRAPQACLDVCRSHVLADGGAAPGATAPHSAAKQ